MTGTLANLTEKVNQMAAQEVQKIETISTRGFENLRENLSSVMQSELDTMHRGISKTIRQTQEQINSQIKILTALANAGW